MDADKAGLPGFSMPEWMKWKSYDRHQNFPRYEVQDITAASPPVQDDGFLHLRKLPLREDMKNENEGQLGSNVLTVYSNKTGDVGFKAVNPSQIKLVDPHVIKGKLETRTSPVSKHMKVVSSDSALIKEKPKTETSTIVETARKISSAALQNNEGQQISGTTQLPVRVIDKKVLERRTSVPEVTRQGLPASQQSFHSGDQEQQAHFQPELRDFSSGGSLNELQSKSKSKSLPPSREATPPASPESSPRVERKNRHRFFSQPDSGASAEEATDLNTSWFTGWFKGSNLSPLDIPSTTQRELSPVTETPESGVFPMETDRPQLMEPSSREKSPVSPQLAMPEMPGAIGIPRQAVEQKNVSKKIVPKASSLREMNTWIPSSM